MPDPKNKKAGTRPLFSKLATNHYTITLPQYQLFPEAVEAVKAVGGWQQAETC